MRVLAPAIVILGILSLVATARSAAPLPALDAPHIVITKSKRRLELFDGARLVRTYRVGLGQNPIPAKERSGDRATPEGRFVVCVRNLHSQFYLSLGLNYPTPADAARGLREGLITRAEHDRIVDAARRGARPPWNTGLGGEIFIHGHGSSSDWTWGCVALDNDDISELFAVVPLGTPVEIAH